MSTLNIDRLHARYRLTPSMRDQKARLDRVLSDVVHQSLELALARCGISSGEEICIKHLDVPVRLKLSEADTDLVAIWSLALAEAILHAAASRPAAFVRYGSPNAARWDMVRSVIEGNYSRAWAWRQLGLWNGSDSSGHANARQNALEVLTSEPDCIIPLLRALLSGHDISIRRVEEFLSGLSTSEWLMLASAALRSVNAEPAWLNGPIEPGIAEIPHLARRVALSSALARCMSAQHLIRIPEGRYALAALILLSEAPEVFDRTPAETRRMLDATAAALFQPVMRHDTLDRVAGAPRRIAENAKHASSPSMDDADRRAPAFDEADENVADRECARTEYGGLLFLLRLLETSGILSELAGLPERPLRWTLHQFAMLLLSMRENDPAALAFAGLRPGDLPPSRDDLPLTAVETAVLAGCAANLREDLDRLLDDPEISPESVILYVCQRKAEILADPGWIDVRFSVDSMSTAIRRTGLDLDPGYIRWLGVVVRFLYE